MPKMISDPEAKDPFKGYMPEQLGSAIRVDGKKLDEYKAEAAAEKAKTPKERMGEAALEAGLTMLKSTPPAKKPVENKAKGGVISASRRADGVASRGKTRGKMC